MNKRGSKSKENEEEGIREEAREKRNKRKE
jgi:hypothetical protein